MAFNARKSVIQRLTQAARAARVRSGAQLAGIGLHPGQEAVLKALAETDGRTMSDLATALAVQPPTVTKMVSRLAAQGYLERRASPGDGRQAHVFLTDQGRETLGAIDDIMKRIEKRALAGLDDKDRRRLRRLLRQVERNLGAGDDGEADEADLLDDALEAAAL